MMQKAARWIVGTATARVYGDTARFLNILVRSGIIPLEIDRVGEALNITVRARQYRLLHAVKRRTGARVRLQARSGLPFLLRRFWKRPGIPIGAALGTVLFLYLSGFIWCFSVEGDVPYAMSEVRRAAAESGVYIGASRTEADLPAAARSLMRRLPRLSWASFNSEGCTVRLQMRMAQERAAGTDKSGVYDVVAARAGLIKEITAPAGNVLVKVGSAVDAGQVLVSGITVVGDPWDPENEVRHVLSHARAKVMAETRHTFTASCPLRVESVRETETGRRRVLYVLGVRIPLSLQGAPPGEVTAREYTPLQLLGVVLPVWVEEQRCAEIRRFQTEFTGEEARARAKETARQLMENYLDGGGRVLGAEWVFTERDGTAYAAVHCVLEEDIAQEVSLYGG